MFVIKLHKEVVIPCISKNKNLIEVILITSGYLVLNGNFNFIRVNLEEIHLSISQDGIRIVELSEDLEGWYCSFDMEHVSNNLIREDLLNEAKIIGSFLYQYPLRLTSGVFERVSFLFNSMMQLLKERNTDFSLVNTYLLASIYEIKKILQDSVLDFYPFKAFSITREYNNLLLKYIEQEHEICFYSNQLNISPNHLNKSVKKTSGKTAINLLNEKRLMIAESKLQFTNLSVSEIAMKLGFADQSYFSRFFKRGTGKTPAEYRKKYKTG